MRLVCPNCDAQYEVDDEAIPQTGRDLQCSNCGHAWFQLPPEVEAEIEAETALFGADVADTQAPTPAVQKPRIPVQTQSDVWQDRGSVPDADDGDDDDDEANAPESAVQAPAPPRRGLDESLLAVLKEEAERETAARRSDTPPPPEQQTELGLEETSGAASAAKAVRDRLARLRGQEAEPETTEKPTARRDLLPDIEEINSTLRASTENRSGEAEDVSHAPAAVETGRSGFRSGFSLMLLIAVVLVATYLAAPKISEHLPATKATMENYVTTVDTARIWLDGAMRNAIKALQDLTGNP